MQTNIILIKEFKLWGSQTPPRPPFGQGGSLASPLGNTMTILQVGDCLDAADNCLVKGMRIWGFRDSIVPGFSYISSGPLSRGFKVDDPEAP